MKKIKKIKAINIDTNDLYFQYIPEKFFRELYTGKTEDMLSLINTPHYRFLILYEKVGDGIWDQYKDTDYVKLMMRWGRNDKFNKKKVSKFIETYKSIKKKGFQGRISVLNKPINKKNFEHGYEIYHGHHRASICKCLGYRNMPCMIYKLK